MTSTLLDVSLCLLLVSGAAATVVTSTPSSPAVTPDAAVRADDVATVLATGTARVEGASGADDATATEAAPRVAHGTFAQHLAAVAVRSTAVGVRSTAGRATSPAATARTGNAAGAAAHDGTGSVASHDAVLDAVRRVLPPRTQVVVSWRPYPNASVGSRLRVGLSPPPSATVHAASQGLPSGIDSGSEAAVDAADDGFDGVADVVAGRLVAGLFPTRHVAVALDAGGPDARRVRARYRRLGRELDVDADALGVVTGRGDPPSAAEVAAANRALAAPLAARIERDLRATFETPDVAARAVRTERVDLVVRTWSA